MQYNIRNRLQNIEHRKKKINVPVLVFIYFDEDKGTWIAQEQYMKADKKGKAIPRSGKVKLIPLEDSSSYNPPTGFKGQIINEGVILE